MTGASGRRVILLVVAGLAAAIPAVADAPKLDEPGFNVNVVLSGESIMGAGAESKIRPAADLEIEGPIAFRASTPLRANIRLRLFGLPGEAFEFTDISTVNAVEVSLGGTRRIGRATIGNQELWTSLEGEWGFTTALPGGENAPASRHLRHFGGGFRLEERASGAWVSLLYGVDEAVGDRGWGQWMVSGAVPLEIKERGVIVIGGDASLSVGPACAVPGCRQQDFVRINVGVSLPDLIAVIR